jgi:hypothetical protein
MDIPFAGEFAGGFLTGSGDTCLFDGPNWRKEENSQNNYHHLLGWNFLVLFRQPASH